MKKNYLELINSDQIEELYVNVFDAHLPGSVSETSYTDVLTADEEVALMQKVLQKEGHEADPWLEFLQQYNKVYPLSNQAVNILFNNIENPKSVPLLVTVLSRFGYNDQQGITLCNLMLQSQDTEFIIRIAQLLCETGRIFFPEVYNLLGKLDVRIKESGYKDQATFAESYQQTLDIRRRHSEATD